jgi:1-deoxy-D-xylulose-5-phosphate synthase
MLINIHCAKCVGIDAIPVIVEVDVATGIGIHLVGLADAAIKESLLRIVTSLQTLGFRIPGRKIVINLAPADMHKKGSGYDFAEEHPENYHSVGPFNLELGADTCAKESFSDVFGEIMCSYAESDEKVCAITAAMCDGTGLSEFSERFPNRFFDVGMAEEHEIAFAGGLSSCGMKPVCALYSTFAQRVFDEVFHDVALQNLPCTIALDRAGFVPDDGATHQGIYDVSLFSSIPGCSIYSPDSYEEMKSSFDKAITGDNISIVRYPKGKEINYPRDRFVSVCDGNVKVCGNEKADVCIVTYGRITANAYEAAKVLEANGVSVKIVKLVKIYPFDACEIAELCSNSKLVYLLEEGIRSGSVSEKLSSIILGATCANVAVNAVKESFPPHAKVDELYEMYGMDSKSIVHDIAKALQNCDK